MSSWSCVYIQRYHNPNPSVEREERRPRASNKRFFFRTLLQYYQVAWCHQASVGDFHSCSEECGVWWVPFLLSTFSRYTCLVDRVEVSQWWAQFTFQAQQSNGFISICWPYSAILIPLSSPSYPIHSEKSFSTEPFFFVFQVFLVPFLLLVGCDVQ